MLRALIFDMDGVLVDSMSYHTRAMAHVFSQMGIRMNKQDIYDLEGSKTVDIVRVLLKKDGVDPATIDLEGLLQNYQEEFDRIVEMKMFAGLRRQPFHLDPAHPEVSLSSGTGVGCGQGDRA